MANPSSDFAVESQKPRVSLLAEFYCYFVTNKKWWLLPILVTLLLLGVLIALSSTGVAPFIYPLF